MPERKLYEFCFDKGLNIRDSLTLSAFRYYSKTGIEQPPEVLHDFYKLAGKFCNFDPLDLPFQEMTNFTQQFSEALAQFMDENV